MAKKDVPTRVTTKVSVGFSHKVGLPNYSSREASLMMEFDTDISADCTEELARRIYDAYEFVKKQVERQVCEHTETFKNAINAIQRAESLEQLEKYATKISERVTEGSIQPWEVDELQETLNEKRVFLTDYTKALEPLPKQKELLGEAHDNTGTAQAE